jgi:hypothetical protein
MYRDARSTKHTKKEIAVLCVTPTVVLKPINIPFEQRFYFVTAKFTHFGCFTKPLASCNVQLKSAILWHFTQRRVTVPYRRFGTTYCSSLQGSILTGCPETSVRHYHSTLRKITKKTHISFTVRRKSELSQIYLSLVLQPAAVFSALFYITRSKTVQERVVVFFKLAHILAFFLDKLRQIAKILSQSTRLSGRHPAVWSCDTLQFINRQHIWVSVFIKATCFETRGLSSG